LEGTQMGTESPRAQRRHEAGFYRSDAEFRALIVPFVEEGMAAGQPVIIGYDDRKAGLLRSWLSDPGAVTFVAGASLYATPALAIASYWQLFERYTAAGATQIRIAGDVPHEGNGGRFAGWDRYEAAINVVWDRFPVWSRCLYDATTLAPRVRDIAERTHPRIVLPSGQYRASGRFQHPADFEPLPPDPDPLERSAPAIDLVDPSAAQVRHAVVSIGRGHLPDPAVQDLVIGASEAVSNAWRHGRPPVTARIWAAAGRVLVRVHDTGPGPGDPLAGLFPAPARPGLQEAGLWLIHVLGLDAALIRSSDGFTVRLAAGHAARPGPAWRNVRDSRRAGPFGTSGESGQ
jgi:anti-sigma regulatory factor (Ser/Thr protein kinase)